MKPKEQEGAKPKNAPMGCLVMALVCIAPFVFIFAALRQAYLDAEHARREFELTVNPNELRDWVLEEFRRHPQGGECFRSQDDLPADFPRFSADYFHLNLYPLADEWGGALLSWSFKNQSLSVRVRLNADGTPANLTDGPQQWAQGIVIERYSK